MSDNIEAVSRRVASLIHRQMQSPNEEGEYPITLELCDIIRRHGTEVVLDQLKVSLKHGQVPLQVKALSVMNQCVLGSGPNVAIALSTEKWSDRFFNIAKSTGSSLLRERLMKQLLQWYAKYRTNGFEQCLGRFAQSKSLKEDFLKVSREVDSESGRTAAASSTAAQSFVDPGGLLPAQPAQRPRATTNVNLGGTQRTAAPQTSTNYTQQQRQAIMQQQQQQQQQQQMQSRMVSAQTLSNLETFILDAQGDLASLEYGLSHPDMLDGVTARDCKKHKIQVGKLLQMEINIPEQYLEALMRLLENLSNALELYEAFSGEDLGEGGISRFGSGFAKTPGKIPGSPSGSPATAVRSGRVVSSASSVTPTAGDDDDDDENAAIRRRHSSDRADPAEAERSALQAQQQVQKLIEEERKELEKARQEVSALRTQNEELSAKYKDAKTKNKKALSMLTESGAQIEELENQIFQLSQGAGAHISPPKPQVVEKIVAEKRYVDPQLISHIRAEIAACRRGLRELKTQSLVDWRREFMFQCSQVQGSVANIVAASQRDRQGDLKQLQWAQDLYKKEQKLRKQYYNQIQELKGNIRVFCRVRPMSERELKDGHSDICAYPSSDELRIVDANGRPKVFEFDNVYAPEVTQLQVFEDTSPLIDSVVDGYNVCIFAYGQTGSGKTFTMTGYEDKGINKRALDRLFRIIDERKESEESTVSISVLEIYCEQIRDLLVSRAESAKNTYDVKTGGPYGNYVTNLSEVTVNSASEIDATMDRAQSNRSEGKTDMNAHSSRSHMILYILVKSRNLHTGVQSYGKLSLVDLAGSERLDKSGSEGQAAKEAVAINKSLSALGDVIAGLSNTGAKHIPFRNSILTFLLQDSMAGQAKVLMFCCISPASYNASESTSSLQFATRARGVSLGQVKKNVIAN